MKEKTESKVKVLLFVDRMLRGGIQTFIVESVRHIDRSKIQLECLVLDDGVKYELEDVLQKIGVNIHKLKGIWLRKPADFFVYKKAVNNFFAKYHDYDVVHLHSSSKNWIILYYAKKYGIPTRIAHSHNIDFQTKSKVQRLLGTAFKPLLKKYATDFFACSKEAGEWLFGHVPTKVIPNPVDLKRFAFDAKKRKIIQKKYQLEGKLVVGHIGRFTAQKNHTLLIQIFSELEKMCPEARLLLVGEGELREEIQDMVRNMGIAEKVIFAGFQAETEYYLSAMDVFVIPSLYEGLPVVLLEAQANGLCCFASEDVISEEGNVSGRIRYISLERSPKEWATQILASDLSRKDCGRQMMEKGYAVEGTAKILEKFYLDHGNNR